MINISVIVPVYNVEEYLERCVYSVLNQEMKDFEVILVDDGSTDKSSQLCDELAICDQRIRVVHKKNEGLGLARNTGLDIACGQYIFFLDSDDYILNDTLLYLFKLIKKYDADIVSVNSYHTQAEQVIIPKQNEEKISIYESNDIIKAYLEKMISGIACGKLYKKSIFLNEKFTDIKLHEDTFSMHFFLQQAKRVVTSNHIGYMQYIRNGSLTQSKFSANKFCSIAVGESLLQFIKEHYSENNYFISLAFENLISRQAWIITDMIKSNAKKQFLSEYKEICLELQQELEIYTKERFYDKSIYKHANLVTYHPVVHRVQIRKEQFTCGIWNKVAQIRTLIGKKLDRIIN